MLHNLALLALWQDETDAIDGRHLIGLELRVATGHYDKRAGMASHQPMDGLAAFVIRHLRHRTGVHHTDVGHLARPHIAHAHFTQTLTDGRRLGEVQLTSKGEVGCFFSFQNRKGTHARER